MSSVSTEAAGPRRSLLVALVVTLVLAGLVGALVLVTGGDDTSAGTEVTPAVTEATPVETAPPTTQPTQRGFRTGAPRH